MLVVGAGLNRTISCRHRSAGGPRRDDSRSLRIDVSRSYCALRAQGLLQECSGRSPPPVYRRAARTGADERRGVGGSANAYGSALRRPIPMGSTARSARAVTFARCGKLGAPVSVLIEPSHPRRPRRSGEPGGGRPPSSTSHHGSEVTATVGASARSESASATGN